MIPRHPHRSLHRHRYLRNAGAVGVALALTACSSGGNDDDDTNASTSAESGAPDDTVLVDGEPMTIDELEATLSTLGGQTVDDLTATHHAGSDTLSVGGLEITWPRLASYVFFDSESTYMPPAWVTHTQLTGIDDRADGASANVDVAVFAQTDVVTDAELRDELFSEAFRLYAFDGDGQLPSDVLHSSITTDDTGRTCFTEIQTVERLSLVTQQAVVLVAGPDIAASGYVIHGIEDAEAGTTSDTTEMAAELVEAICGTRPEGL